MVVRIGGKNGDGGKKSKSGEEDGGTMKKMVVGRWLRRLGFQFGVLSDTNCGITLSDAKYKWNLPNAPDNIYTTKWMRNQFMEQRYSGVVTTNRWNKWIPKKSNTFMWRIFKGRLPVKTVLHRLGANITELKCSLCSQLDESVDHIFLKCDSAQHLWCRLGYWWQTAIPDFQSLDKEELRKMNESEIDQLLSLVLVAVQNLSPFAVGFLHSVLMLALGGAVCGAGLGLT
ncbi:hypothetical protein LXL04_016115 [Taraxacum kok-saghyz]